MYDTVNMYLSREQVPDISYLKEIPQYLTSVSNEGVSCFGEYINGYLGTLKVSISERRVKISDSSLCKYYLGDNFKSLARGDTKRAIEKICDELHLPFSKAPITRLDIAHNMMMKYPEKNYYQYLGEAQYYKRLEQSNGLYYNTQKRQLVFYGKEYEQRTKHKPIPDLYKKRSVLRYELRFKSRLKEQFKRSEITAALLYDQDFYSYLLKRWEKEYFAIQKITNKMTSLVPNGSTKNFIENLALLSLLDIGQPKVLATVKEWQSTGKVTKKQASDIRSKVKKLSMQPISDKGNFLIDELDKKIVQVARCG